MFLPGFDWIIKIGNFTSTSTKIAFMSSAKKHVFPKNAPRLSSGINTILEQITGALIQCEFRSHLSSP